MLKASSEKILVFFAVSHFIKEAGMRIFDDKTIIVIRTSYEGYSVNSSLLFNTTHDTFKRWGCYLITQHFHFVVTSIVFNDSSFWQKLRLCMRAGYPDIT